MRETPLFPEMEGGAPSRPPKEVARRLGIANVANFTRLFTHHMGVPPGRFRDSVGPVGEPMLGC
jgi:AraC-like DNA-binding protein